MRKFKKSGFLKNKSLDIVSRFFLSSFIVISFFYVVPIIINFADKNFNNKEFTNNSKNILNNTLNKDKLIEEDTTTDADERDLLYDILEENYSEINLVRYTTSEIDSLFKEVNYKISDGSKNNLKIIDINVEEQPTGEIGAGAGIGTSGGTIAFNIKENNWLGEGKSLSFN